MDAAAALLNMVGEFVDEEPIMRVPLTQSLAKTGTFALVHFTVAFGVAFLLTGSAAIAGALALLEPLANTVAFLLHERAWARFTPWRAAAAPTVQQSSVGRSC